MAKQTFTVGQVLTAAQLTSLQQTAMLGGAASNKTSSYTLVSADAGTAISMTSTSATTVTVNTGLFAAGDTVQITNLGSGVSTITAGSATVDTSASLALAQYESGTLDFTSTSAAIFIKGAGAAASAAPTSGTNYVATTQSTSSGSFVNLTTTQSVTLTTGTKVLVFIGAEMNSDSTARGGIMSFAISGATTLSADAAWGAGFQAGDKFFISRHSTHTVTAGSNVFTAKFAVRAEPNTANFGNRYITVIDLGS